MLDSFWYLSSPYSKYGGGIEDAAQQASRAAALLTKAKIPVFSPIAHSHALAMAGGIDPKDHAIWLPADEPFMRLAHGLIVLRMTGWRESHGINEELKVFRAAKKPIVFMDPGRVPEELL